MKEPTIKKRFVSLSTKLLGGVLLISSVLTLVTTIFQIYIDYKSDVADLEKRINQIQVSHVGPITSLLWDFNENQIDVSLQSILNLPDIIAVQLREKDGQISYKNGAVRGNVVEKSFPLIYRTEGIKEKELGKLTVFASLQGIKERLTEKIILIAISQSIKTFLASLLILLLVNYLINRHLKTMNRFFADYSPGAKPMKLLELSRKQSHHEDELDHLKVAVNRMITMLSELLSNLEQKIQERTAELWNKARDIRSLLNNMHQGVLTVVGDSTIGHEYSKFTETIFECTELGGKRLADIMGMDSNLQSNQVAQLTAALDTIVGYSELAFQVNRHLLPSRVIKSGMKRLELEWNSIVDKDHNVEKVLLLVRDVTEVEQLRQESEQRKQELEIIDCILKMQVTKFIEFYHASVAELLRFKNSLKHSSNAAETMRELFIFLHTLKSTARMHKLSAVVESIHTAESSCAKFRDNDNMIVDFAEISRDLNAVEAKFQLFYDIVRQKFQNVMKIDESNFTILNTLDQLIAKRQTPDAERLKILDNILSIRQSCFWVPLREILHDTLASVPNIAAALGVEAPIVIIEGSDTRIDKEAGDQLAKIFLHCFRNSLAHGLEHREARLQAGKGARGCILLDVALGSDLVFTYGDDGKGLDLARLRALGIAKGTIGAEASDLDVADTIFTPGISTAATVGEVAGRGVGMDAVRKFCGDLGGSVRVELTPGRRNPDFANFKLVFTFPARIAVAAKKGS